MFKDIIVLALVIWLISMIFTRYIRPIFRFTSVASDSVRKMQQMQAKMEEMQQKANQQHQNATGYRMDQKKHTEKPGDYIDYEEI